MKKTLISIAAICTTVLASAQWAPVGEEIKTPWAAQVDPENVLPEYPRPQMVRQTWSNLNGLWDYAITSVEAEGFEAEGKILVPFAVESSLSGVGRRITKENSLWYERTFTVPSGWKGKNVLLHFGGVDWKAEVFVNGQRVGEHKGGFDPFSYDITPYLKKSSKQTLTVKVFDATDNGMQPRGKQCIVNSAIWYTPVSGIWQTVWMEPVDKTHITSYYPVSNLAKSLITVDVKTANAYSRDVIKVELLEGGVGYNPEKPSETVLAEAVVSKGKAVLNVPEMKTWSPDSPYLYGLRITVTRDEKVIDQIEGYTAMRSISAKKDKSPNQYKRMALNGENLFQYGPLDQGWWPDGLYTAPCDEALKFDIEKTKEMGYNMIRKHIKVEPARWYYWCDVLGMMVWQDMPSIGDFAGTQLRSRDLDVQKTAAEKILFHNFSGRQIPDKPPGSAGTEGTTDRTAHLGTQAESVSSIQCSQNGTFDRFVIRQTQQQFAAPVRGGFLPVHLYTVAGIFSVQKFLDFCGKIGHLPGVGNKFFCGPVIDLLCTVGTFSVTFDKCTQFLHIRKDQRRFPFRNRFRIAYC